MPGVGYRVFWLWGYEAEKFDKSSFGADQLTISNKTAQDTTKKLSKSGSFVKEVNLEAENIVLENEFLRVLVDSKTGNLTSIFDKVYSREFLKYSEGENQLQAFTDGGQYWDAWNIDPDYHHHPLPPPQLKEIYWLERGSLRWRLRVIRNIENSEFCQDYVLESRSRVLKVENRVNWQSSHVMVKAAFAFNVDSDRVTYEIPCGVIDRPTKPQSSTEKAKWEVPVLRWADLSDDGYGVSFLNDCKYGYDFDGDRLRLTLLRGSTWPDPQADLGIHYFTYAIYPHSGGWQDAGTVRRGYELNLPLLTRIIAANFQKQNQSNSSFLPAVKSWLNLEADNLILMAFKQAEDDSQNWILRFYEAEGKKIDFELNNNLGLRAIAPVNLLEESAVSFQEVNRRSFEIFPWKIFSLLATNC